MKKSGVNPGADRRKKFTRQGTRDSSLSAGTAARDPRTWRGLLRVYPSDSSRVFTSHVAAVEWGTG
jgi:hypothetical protein